MSEKIPDVTDPKFVRWINDLFGDVRQFCDEMSEMALFRVALLLQTNETVRGKVFAFMRDVRTCPPEVIEYALRLLETERANRTEAHIHLDAPVNCPVCNKR